mmetsp:Transcript_9775/g.14500  ORF Transcript_9775/g.14500 Transcript_9775/m.14500 type:complete len:91 (+) Transcript_9775:40-312(+)
MAQKRGKSGEMRVVAMQDIDLRRLALRSNRTWRGKREGRTFFGGAYFDMNSGISACVGFGKAKREMSKVARAYLASDHRIGTRTEDKQLF